MSQRAANGASGTLQATIFKKCSTAFHRPATNKACAGGTCQHTCQPPEVERCRHAWTVRYNVNGAQRDKSFRDEIDAGRRVRYGTGLKKARDFQLELTRNKRAQGRTYVDPAAGNELYGPAAEAFISKSPAIEAGAESRRAYLCNYRTSLKPVFAGRTLAQMAGQAAADEAAELLNVTLAGKSIGYRRIARMILTGTMDAAVKAEKIGRHKLGGISLTEGTSAAAASDDDEEEEAGGLVFIADAQVSQLADGITITGENGRARHLAGVAIAAWLQRTMGLRIREAL